MHSECKENACTCACQKRRKSTHVLDARPWTQKPMHTSERHIYDSGRPPTHFWFISQVDLTPKSELNPSGGLVKDLKGPLFTLKTGSIMPQRFSIKRAMVELYFQESICIVILPLFSYKEPLSSLEHTSTISLVHSHHLVSE